MPQLIEMTAESRVDELYNEAANRLLPTTAREGLIVLALSVQRDNINNPENALFVLSLRDQRSPPAIPPDDPLASALERLSSGSSSTQPLVIVLSAVKNVLQTRNLGTLDELLANSTDGWTLGLLMSRPMRKIWRRYWQEPAQIVADIGLINSLIQEINLVYDRPREENTIPIELVDLVDERLRARRQYRVDGNQELLFNDEADEEILNHQRQGTLPYLDFYLDTETFEQSQQRLIDQNRMLNDLAGIADESAPPGYTNPYTNEYLRFTSTLSIAWDHAIFIPRAREVCQEINNEIIEGNFQRQIEPERGLIKFDALENFLKRGMRLKDRTPELEEVDNFYSDFRHLCREEHYPGEWVRIVRRSFRDQITPSQSSSSEIVRVQNSTSGQSVMITPTTSMTPTTIPDTDAPVTRQNTPYPDHGTLHSRQANTMFTRSTTASTARRLYPQPSRNALTVATPAPGFTACGQKILAYLGDNRRQCIIEENQAGQLRYVLRGQSEIGGFGVVNAAIRSANIPRLGKNDSALLAQRETLIFSAITKIALAPNNLQNRLQRRNLPVCFFLVDWENHETCWVSRTMLERITGKSFIGSI